MTAFAGAEGRGDRPVRRRSRFTLARARAEPLALSENRFRHDRGIGRGGDATLPMLTPRGGRSLVRLGMWTLIRTLLVALALTGFIGQTTALAAPSATMAPAAASMDMSDCCPDCPETGAPASDPASKSRVPCQDMSPACLAKMGCAAAAIPLPTSAVLKTPIRPSRLAGARPADTDRDGAGPPPLQGPPKLQA